MAKAVLVTGASRGIGQACALRLAGHGFRVFAGVRDGARGAELRAQAGEALSAVHLDVTDAASIAAARAQVEDALGDEGLAGLVNNAGVAVAGPLELLSPADLRQQLEINVVGQLAVTQAFLPLLRRGRGRGRVVFISSVSGFSALPITGAYAASKHALEAMADALRLELRPWGIAVSLVEPGIIATEIWQHSAAAAEARFGQVDAATLEPYRRVVDGARRRAVDAAAGGLPPDAVARVVERALTSARPRARYRVGRDARVRILLERLLPTRLRDARVARVLARM